MGPAINGSKSKEPKEPIRELAKAALSSEGSLMDFMRDVVMNPDLLSDLTGFPLTACRSVSNAAKFAEVAHEGQTRKGTDIPYIIHPFGVAALLLREMCAPEIVIAGLLHDTVEDAGITIQQIAQDYGERVAEIVRGCSEPDKSLTWRERKEHTIEYIKNAPHGVSMVTCADKLDNITAIVRDYDEIGEKLWLRFNAGKERQRWYYHGLLDSLGETDFVGTLLFKEFEEKVFEIFDVPNPWAEPPDLSEYHYFEKEGVIYRRRENAASLGIEEIFTIDGWKPYSGDGLAPVHFGNRITEEDIVNVGQVKSKETKYAMDGEDLLELLKAKGLKIVEL